jgi:hypothetical protein
MRSAELVETDAGVVCALLSGDRKSFDINQVRTAATVAFGAPARTWRIATLFIAVGPLEKQIITKLQRGVISNVSNSTLGKIMTSHMDKVKTFLTCQPSYQP